MQLHLSIDNDSTYLSIGNACNVWSRYHDEGKTFFHKVTHCFGASATRFLQKGIALAGLGIVAGMVVSASTASMMASLMSGVRPHDRLVLLAVPLLLFAVAVLASYFPARRATKVDPMFALREVGTYGSRLNTLGLIPVKPG